MDRRDFLKTAGTATTLALAGARLSAQGDAELPRHYLHSYTHRLDMERGFKFHCLVPGETDVGFGRHEYAGFFTLRVGEGPWMFTGDRPPEHVATPQSLRDLLHCPLSIARDTGRYRIEQRANWVAGDASVELSATVRSDAETSLTGGLMGWSWAERQAPSEWVADGWTDMRPTDGQMEVPGRTEWVGYHDVSAGFSGLLVFSQPVQRLWTDSDGVYWEWGACQAGEETQLPPFIYLVAPALLTGDALAALVPDLKLMTWAPPERFAAALALRPVWMPPSRPFPPQATEGHAIPSVAGEMRLAPTQAQAALPPLPDLRELQRPMPAVAGRGVEQAVTRHVEDALAHREPDGRFTFSLGRTFYDALTCAALAQALPVLSEPPRSHTAEAVRDCLDALCDAHVRSDAYGLLVPPEQEGFVRTAIDYPEIAGCLLYAILAYTLNADASYAATRRDLLDTHHSQIKQMVTPEGLSWARADTAQVHLIAESAIGGYVALASLHHLARHVPDASWADVCERPARRAWVAYRELFRWRPEFGESGVVNGWSNWTAETKRPEPWAYVQTTWFSFVPMVPVEREDRYNLWRSLREQPWWDYTGAQGSRQRCYDYANALALARAGYVDEVREHWEAINNRPFWYDTFDATPVMAIAALPQLAAMGVP